MDRKLLLAVASASAFLGAALLGTSAFSAEEEAQMRVAVGDINLHSDRGAAQALRRIEKASNAFCSVEPGVRDLKRTLLARECARRMTYLSVTQLDAPLVSATYDKSTTPPIMLASRR